MSMMRFALACVVVGGVGWAGLTDSHNLVPRPYWKFPSIVIATLLTAYGLIERSRCKDASGSEGRPGAFGISGISLTLIPFMWGIAFFAVWMGIPSIWSSFALTPRAATVHATHASIKDTRSRNWSRGCGHRIGIQGEPLPEPMTPCVPRAMWNTVKPGDRLIIAYTDGFGAFVIRRVSPA